MKLSSRYTAALSRIGATGASDFLLAGEKYDGMTFARYQQIENCSFMLAWFGDRNEVWWSEVACAALKGKRVFAAEPDIESILSMPSEARVFEWASTSLSDTRDLESAAFLALALNAHDQSRQFRGGRWLGWLADILETAESPIEARLAVHLFGFITDNTTCRLYGQRKSLDGKYRVDLAVTNEDSDPKDADYPGPIHIAIECDGHNFHERTKEQATRDKRRDRELTTEGWRVLRFTGSEIWNDPKSCSEQVLRVVESVGGWV